MSFLLAIEKEFALLSTEQRYAGLSGCGLNTADGYLVNHTPSVGAVFQTDAGALGHVAYVSAVNTTNGDWTISEMNAKGLNVVDTRVFRPSSARFYSFIHDKAKSGL